MDRKQYKDASVDRKKGNKCTESLKDLLFSLGIHGSKDWREYVNKITENKASVLESPQPCKEMAGSTGKNLRNNSFKLLEDKVENPDVPEKKYQMCRVLGKIFSLLFDQGPIEQISSLVYTIFSITTSVIVGPEGLPSIKNVPQKPGLRLLPPHIDEPLNVLLDRMLVLCSDPPKLPTETIKKCDRAEVPSDLGKDKNAAPKIKLTKEKKYAAGRNNKYSIPEQSQKARNILTKS